MTGHFVGACPKAKREERQRREERIAEERQRRKQEEKRAKNDSESSRRAAKNAFSAIYEDSDNEDEVVQCVVVESRPIVKRKRILNWADTDSESEEE
jgi:hypothetical protein